MEHTEQARCRELSKSSTFYRSVYSQIEEVGWEHLVRLGGDLTFLSFRILDEKGRLHFMEIQMDKTYPKSPPSISAVGFLSSLWKLKFCIIGINYL
jgi:E3 ubiquitin-protein ligase FANCL